MHYHVSTDEAAKSTTEHHHLLLLLIRHRNGFDVELLRPCFRERLDKHVFREQGHGTLAIRAAEFGEPVVSNHCRREAAFAEIRLHQLQTACFGKFELIGIRFSLCCWQFVESFLSRFRISNSTVRQGEPQQKLALGHRAIWMFLQALFQ